MPDFGFVGPSYVTQGPYQDDQELINWFCERDKNYDAKSILEAPGRGIIALYPTPGLVLRGTFSAGVEVRGFHTLPGGTLFLAVCGDQLYSITTAFVATAVGTLATSSGHVSIDDNGVDAMIGDGANRYTYTWTTGVFAASVDGAFTGAGSVGIVDNYLIYNRVGTQQWGCTNALSTVSSALNVASKDGSSDNLVGLIVVNRQVFLMGELTYEVWTDQGTFPFPFQRIPGTSKQHGCAAAATIARFGEGFAWLTNDTRGNATIAMMVGYEPLRISTHPVEYALEQYATISDAFAYSYQQSGHEFYVITFPSADVTWCYDLATQLWHKRAWRDTRNVLHRHRSNCVASFDGHIVVGDWQNGSLYTFSQTTYTDNGTEIPCIRRAPHLTSNLNEQYFHNLQIQFQPGVGLQTGQGTDPQAMLTWSDDGGSTWSNQHWASIGRVGKYKNRARWRRLGKARDRIFQVEVTDPVFRTVVSANLDATPGAT